MRGYEHKKQEDNRKWGYPKIADILLVWSERGILFLRDLSHTKTSFGRPARNMYRAQD